MSSNNVRTMGEGDSMELRKVKDELSRLTRKHEDLVEKLRDKVECPVCLEVPKKAPIYVCYNGHVVCEVCVREKCPSCRSSMVRSNNILAVTVVENIDHQCQHCNNYFSWENLAQHKKECQHREVKCPYLPCDSMVSLASLKEHVLNGCFDKAVIRENMMPCVFNFYFPTSALRKNDLNWRLRVMCFEEKQFFLKTTRRSFHGRVRWMFYVQMNGNAEETSNFTATILVFRYGDSPGEGEYCHRYSGDICPIDVSSVEDADDQGYCLSLRNCLMSKLLSEVDEKTKFSVRINIMKRS